MRVWLVDKKISIILLVFICAFFTLILMGHVNKNSEAMSVLNTQERDLPIYCVDTDEKKIAISFDAAWGCEDTETLIDILGERNIKTTFFVVGEWVDKYPDAVKKLSDAGHEVMNHSATHPHMTQISTEKMKQELDECGSKIEAVTGVRPNLFRPPYGDYNNDVVGAARECGYYTIQWSVDSLDWKDLSADEIYDRVVSKAEPGSIVLFHNAAKHTPEALPKILDKLTGDGYEIVPVSELIIKDNYKIDANGMQYSTNNDQSEGNND
ncbi:MAG TPA: polysaccharide deacetylase family protein [Candidatus Monoglobus merdigallinarum]|uniref:Polysaccharide deacetylase family protein n=1 Tax=Candidatus Monoglobus merdigallinarum TaxID=2838698 RepID=A0A9D1TL15_9FIRM|nr:polysaccharide deacetylase family protein [Candidatus Monoglobus merdigallinarum]